jgi:hypothetical protein
MHFESAIAIGSPVSSGACMRNDSETQDGPGNGNLPVLRLEHDFNFILCLSNFLVRSASRIRCIYSTFEE